VPATAKRILIVEDDDDLRTLFHLALTLEGFDVDDASTGWDALRLFENDPPDLVVLDLALPGLDGFAVQQEIAAQQTGTRIPIVVVTSSPRELSSLDVACVLRKPISPDELVRTVRRCLANPTGTAGA
jgi:two-component system, sensor histidine kinase and response regulator